MNLTDQSILSFASARKGTDLVEFTVYHGGGVRFTPSPNGGQVRSIPGSGARVPVREFTGSLLHAMNPKEIKLPNGTVRCKTVALKDGGFLHVDRIMIPLVVPARQNKPQKPVPRRTVARRAP